METIIIVVLLMFVLLIGFRYYGAISINEAQNLERDRQQQELNTLWLQLSSMPSLSCPKSVPQGCIDLIKLEIVSEWIVDQTSSEFNQAYRLLYYDMYGDVRITVMDLYPNSGTHLLYDEIDDTGSSVARDLPITVYDPGTNTYTLARLLIEVNT